MASWTVRAYRPGDEVGINDLFNIVFERDRPLSVWQWKFDRNPATEEKVIAVAESESGEIVGVYPALPMRFRFGDRTVIATQPVDNCIAPDCRGGGRLQVALFREFVRRMREIGAGFAFGFPNEVAYRVGKRLLKYSDLTALMLRDRRMSFRQAVHRRTQAPALRQVGEAVGRGLVTLGLGWQRLAVPRDVVIEAAADFDERFDTLRPRINGDALVSPIRDQAYLRWRYVGNPGGGFRILRACRGDRLAGYFVGKLQEEPAGVRVGYVLEVAAEDEPALRALLCRGLSDFRAAGADWARCGLLPHRAIGGPYATLGFRRDVGRMPAVYAIYDETLERRLFEDPGQWDFCLGDSDMFTEGI